MLKPLADRVLLLIEKAAEEKTAGGLVLAAKNPAGVPLKGKVVAVGSGKTTLDGTRIPVEVKTGETVYVAQGAGTKVKLDGEEYTLVYESEILGIAE